ncbi:MAG TPA: nucleotide pyrophosphohydrolase [Candidatus Paceibacterota bacterium]|nr:nucleotide pyrophosphohydrolase [Candidatus Paceibacterota bacterium]
MKHIQDDIRAYLTERNWNNLRPGDIAKSISIEAAELLEVFQWENPELDAVKADSEKLAEIRNELADVFIYCLDMATLLDLDAESIVREKLEKVKSKYPAELFQGVQNSPGTEDIYMKIKQAHRNQGNA